MKTTINALKNTLKKKLLKRFSLLPVSLVVLFAAVMSYVILHSFAATGPANLYTSPSGTQAAATGATFNVDVRISTAGNVPVSGASIYLAYPSDKLQFKSVSYPGSPYNLAIQETVSSGILRIDRAASPSSPGGDQLFARVSFKTLATGSAPLSFTNSSYVTSADDDSDLPIQKTAATYNINAPDNTPAGGSAAPSPPAAGSKPRTSGGTSASPAELSSQGEPSPAASTPNPTSPTNPAQTFATESPSPTSDLSSDDKGLSSLLKIAIAVAVLAALTGMLFGANLLRTHFVAPNRGRGHVPGLSPPAPVLPVGGGSAPPTSQPPLASLTIEERLYRLPNSATTTPGTIFSPENGVSSGQSRPTIPPQGQNEIHYPPADSKLSS